MIVSLPPTRSNSRSWIVRRSLIWTSIGRSPISSRNRVPPSASSNRPGRRCSAPVKLPFSWPNSSDSRMPGASAAQLTRTNGLSSRATVDVDRVRDQLLAGAGLAAQEHGRVRRRDLLDLGEHLAQRGALADDVAEVELAVQLLVEVPGVLGQLLDEALVLARQVEPLDRVLQDAADLLGLPRLGDVAVDLAEVDRLDEDVDVGERGEDDADRVGAELARLAQHLEARHLRHPLVGDDHGDVVIREHRERLGPLVAVWRSSVLRKLNRKASRLSCSSSTIRTG